MLTAVDVQGICVTLVPKSVKNLSVIPSETVDDASIDLGSAVGIKMLNAIARKIDAALLKGDLPKGPAGVWDYPHLPSIGGPVSYDSLMYAAAAAREARGDPRYAFISPSSLSDLQKETDASSRPLLSNDPQAGPVTRRQVSSCSLRPPSPQVRGSSSIQQASRPRCASRPHSKATSAKFASDQVALRAKARVDGAVGLPEAFCKIESS